MIALWTRERSISLVLSEALLVCRRRSSVGVGSHALDLAVPKLILAVEAKWLSMETPVTGLRLAPELFEGIIIRDALK